MWFFGGSSGASNAKVDDSAHSNSIEAISDAAKSPIPSEYRVIPSSFDATKLHPMANVGSGELEYLDLETNSKKADGLIASRGFTEDLAYGTGAVYLLGLGAGGLMGLIEGMRSTQDTMSARLRVNSVLNSVTRRGPYLGNTAGSLALTYNLVGGVIEYARDGHSDEAGSLAAGAITGALFNASRGVKPMMLSSVVLTGVTAGWLILKRAVAPPDDA